MTYMNEDRQCECHKCERSYQNTHDINNYCKYYEKFQRLPKDIDRAGLGLCHKLKENG